MGAISIALVTGACARSSGQAVRPVVTSTVTRGSSGSPTTVAAAGCASGWKIAAKPYTQGVVADHLVAATAASVNDIWAVGTRFPPKPGEMGDALIEHFDGRAWTIVPGADLGGRSASLAAVAALAPDNAWAVGSVYGSAGADSRHDPLIEHWDGRRWSLVAGPPPTLGVASSSLIGVADIRSDNVWIEGQDTLAGKTSSMSGDFYEHWDGQRWTLSRGPQAVTAGSGLAATQTISVDPAGDAWAAGGKIRGQGEGGQGAGALVERWDGSSWVEMPPPAGGSAVGTLAVVGPGSVWAVTGAGLVTANGAYGSTARAQFVHWDGARWTVSAQADGVRGLAARGPADIWAAGSTGGVSNAQPAPLVEHWDGTAWHPVDTHPPQLVALTSLSIAGDGAVVAFASDYPRSPNGSPIASPENLRNYLWIDCP